MQDADRPAVAEFIERHWHDKKVMSQGRAYYPHEECGILQRNHGELVGVLTYRVEDGALEILTLNATVHGSGIGTALMLAAIDKARHAACRRIFLTTTNDALRAMRFYQRLGFRMVAVNIGAVDAARVEKPSIPETGEGGIGIHDEILMELMVEPYLDGAE